MRLMCSHKKKQGERFFSRVCWDRTGGNGFRLEEERCRLDIRKEVFTIKVVSTGIGCPER